MSKGIIVDTSYFDGVDLDRPSVKHDFMAKMQANAKAKDEQNRLDSFFDVDVQQTLRMHNTPQDRVRLNNVIRALYSTA